MLSGIELYPRWVPLKDYYFRFASFYRRTEKQNTDQRAR